MARAFALHLDVDELKKRGVALGELAGGDVGKAIVSALNDTVDSAYDLSRKRMLAGINLSDQYLRRKMNVEHATPSRPRAELVAIGLETTLSHFDSAQHQKAVNWSNARIASMGKKFGKWPGWTRRTGNTPLGIMADRKADGQSAAIKQGARAAFQHTFAIPGRTDGEGNNLMFTRKKGSDKMRVLLGPAVYQLFKYQLNGTLLGETEDALAEALSKQVEIAMQKALES